MIQKISDVIDNDDAVRVAAASRDTAKVIPELSTIILDNYEHEVWLYEENGDAVCSIVTDDHVVRIVVGENVNPTRFKVTSNDKTIVCFFTNNNNDINWTIITLGDGKDDTEHIVHGFSITADETFPVIKHMLLIAQAYEDDNCIAAILVHTVNNDGEESLETFKINSSEEPDMQITSGDRALTIHTSGGQRLVDLCHISFADKPHVGAVVETLLEGKMCNVLYFCTDIINNTFSGVDLDNSVEFDAFRESHGLERKHPIVEEVST